MFFKIWCILLVGTLLYLEYDNNVYAPSNIINNIQENMKEKIISITLIDKYSIQKGGSLLQGVYNEYHYIGYDSNSTQYDIINYSDSKYHYTKINQTYNFICTNYDTIRCK